MTDYLFWLFAAAVVGLGIWRDVRTERRNRADGRCGVCGGTSTPICDVCVRCLDTSCNGGCIFCRQDMPFGRKLKARPR